MPAWLSMAVNIITLSGILDNLSSSLFLKSVSHQWISTMNDRGITIGKSWPRAATPCDPVPQWEGEFKDHGDWVSFASQRLQVAEDSNGYPLSAICVDTLGRRCANGGDFMRARDEGTFPVRYFWDCCEPNTEKEHDHASIL
jgi:hypothetical protein